MTAVEAPTRDELLARAREMDGWDEFVDWAGSRPLYVDRLADRVRWLSAAARWLAGEGPTPGGGWGGQPHEIHWIGGAQRLMEERDREMGTDTTGLPLGVRLRHRTLLALLIALEDEELRAVLFPPRQAARGHIPSER